MVSGVVGKTLPRNTMSLLHDAVPNEIIFAVLDNLVSSLSPPDIQKMLIPFAATCRRFKDLIMPVMLRLQTLRLKEMMRQNVLQVVSIEGYLLNSEVLDCEHPASLGAADVTSISYIIKPWVGTASQFINIATSLKDPVVPIRWIENHPDVADIWAVRSLLARSRGLKRFNLHFAAYVPLPSSQSLRAVGALVNACFQHQDIIFMAEGNVYPWDCRDIPTIPTQPNSQPSENSNAIGSRLIHAVRSLIPRREDPLPATSNPSQEHSHLDVPLSLISVPSQVHLYSDVLLEGLCAMPDLCVFQPSLTQLSIHSHSLDSSAWSFFFDSCHLPVLQLLALSAPKLSFSNYFDFLFRHPSLVTLSLDTYTGQTSSWSTQNKLQCWSIPEKIMKGSELLPNLTELLARAEITMMLLFNARALPKLQTLTINNIPAVSNFDSSQVLHFLREVRHQSVTPVSHLSFVFLDRDKGSERIRERTALLTRELRYGSFTSVAILYTRRNRHDYSPQLKPLKVILPWIHWLRQCPALETFRIDGMVREILIDKDGEEKVCHPRSERESATIESGMSQVRAGITVQWQEGMWKACPRLQGFSVEGETFERSDTSMPP